MANYRRATGSFRALNLPVIAVNLVVILFTLSAVFPLVWMFYNSMKTTAEFSVDILSLPKHWNIDVYARILASTETWRVFFNSAFTAVVSTVVTISLAFLVSYCLVRFRFPGRNFLYAFFLLGLLVPVYGLLVPIFIQFNALGMADRRWTLLLPYSAFAMSQAVFLIESYLHSVPMEIEEGAFIDGAGMVRRLTSIVFPMCSPIITTAAILAFLSCWNEFGFALVLIDNEALKTIPLWLKGFQGERTIDYTTLMAALLIASLPVIIIYAAFREKIIAGFTSGALKG
jgi:raffinose/stachyose/melibiose transport system permease protein